jgi:hypothetical protein
VNKKVIEAIDQEVDQHLAALLARATTEPVRRKLRNLHEACRHLVRRNIVLTVNGVREACDKLFEEKIGESTIRNKCGGNNPYQSLYRKWENAAAAKAAASARNIKLLDAGTIDEDQIRQITPVSMQHAVTLLAVKARSLERQLNILREEKTDIPLVVEGAPMLAGNSDLVLSTGEVESLREFLDPRSLGAKMLKKSTDGSVQFKDGRVIADPGFLSALEKIVRSYQRP